MSRGVAATMTIGQIVEQRRLDLGLTKAAAARRAGVSRGTWHELESGHRPNMQPDTMHQIDVADQEAS
jgi:DNA-binding XRE family transcriptional regulator